ncbi:MAG: ankyrin repeat domain-containing protein [Thermofilum sp.]
MSELHETVREGDLQRVKKLLEQGADVNAKDDLGWTPLHWAALIGHLEVARFLVEKGADINARSNGGWIPLHFAAFNGRLEVVRFLLEAGANPTLRDYKGRTPADLAREQGHGDVAKLLEGWVKEAQTPLIASVEVGGLVEGEWGVLRVKLNFPSTLVVEGDVEWVDPGLVEGVVEVPVKARKAGRVPVTVVAKSSGKEERKVVWVEVSRGVCPSCKAPIEPGAKYCWKCGAYLA